MKLVIDLTRLILFCAWLFWPTAGGGGQCVVVVKLTTVDKISSCSVRDSAAAAAVTSFSDGGLL